MHLQHNLSFSSSAWCSADAVPCILVDCSAVEVVEWKGGEMEVGYELESKLMKQSEKGMAGRKVGNDKEKEVATERELDRDPNISSILRMSCSLVSSSAVGGRCAGLLWRHCLINTTTEFFPPKSCSALLKYCSRLLTSERACNPSASV